MSGKQDADPAARSRDGSGHSTARKLEESDAVARVVGEEFIYKPADGLAITSLFACVWCDSLLPRGAPYAAKFTVHLL